ncbi:MAG: hypothetical protein HXX15_17165 [Rhodopseudomonas sp.]|nr:hypothetical protein [Rhodopseudomonas sp.]NVN87810.1 hypothetical protein [Rhodopseudomonas sp.]
MSASRQPDTPFQPAITEPKERPMLDIIMLAIGLGLFALSVGYAYGCEWL